MINIGIHGALGKMGRAIARLAKQDSNLRLAAAFAINADSAILSEGISRDILYSQLDEKVLKNIDVLIDFSVPEASLKVLKLCRELKIPMVIGTTGFIPEEEKIINEAGDHIALLKSSNMSIGVNLLFGLTRIAAGILKNRNFQAEMMEIHHGKKKDAPSGTAKSLENILLEQMSLDRNVTYGRSGMVGERKPKELGSFALRGGDVVGDHTVFFLGEGERIELKHQATNRDVFARGALDAAKYIAGKPPAKLRVYTMDQVLNLPDAAED